MRARARTRCSSGPWRRRAPPTPPRSRRAPWWRASKARQDEQPARRDRMRSRQFSEEELRAIEAEMVKLRVDDVLLQTLVTLINLGARKLGPQPVPGPPERGGAGGEGSEPVRDLEEVRLAIEGARALLPVLEPRHGAELGQVKQALSQLQIAWAQLSAAPQKPADTEPVPTSE